MSPLFFRSRPLGQGHEPRHRGPYLIRLTCSEKGGAMTFDSKSYEIKQHTKMFVIAFFDALIAQFYFDALPFEFKFSISVAILPIYYYFDRSLNPIKTALYVTTVGIAFRTFTQANALGSLSEAFWVDFNFVFFDIVYGLLFYFLYYKRKHVKLSQWVLIAVGADAFSNIIEAFTRHGFDIFLDSNALLIFFLVAIIRVIIGLVIITFMKQYTFLIRKDEHEIRYKELVVLTSDLKSEAYFMQKNMDFIEKVMGDAYSMYSDFEALDSEALKKLSLKIATEVHEIKKNYSRVVEGLTKITAHEPMEDCMKISVLLKILKDSMSKYMMGQGSPIKLYVSGHSSDLIAEHYLLMSVLRNLVNNAVEAISIRKEGHIVLRYDEEDGYHVFRVTDNGSGIEPADLKYIFEAGFSTKFNDATGDICRGVGLTLVKEIVEHQLGGYIEVVSERGLGTTFKVFIMK